MNDSRIRLEFKGSYLKQDKATFTPNSVVNLLNCLWTRYMVTRFKHWFTLKDCLFGFVDLTKNADPDKYKYSGNSIGFDSRSEFH